MSKDTERKLDLTLLGYPHEVAENYPVKCKPGAANQPLAQNCMQSPIPGDGALKSPPALFHGFCPHGIL